LHSRHTQRLKQRAIHVSALIAFCAFPRCSIQLRFLIFERGSSTLLRGLWSEGHGGPCMSFRRFSPDAPRLCMYIGSSLIIASYWKESSALPSVDSGCALVIIRSLHWVHQCKPALGPINLLEYFWGCKSESGARKPTELHLCHPKSIQVLIAGMVSSAREPTTWPELKMMLACSL